MSVTGEVRGGAEPQSGESGGGGQRGPTSRPAGDSHFDRTPPQDVAAEQSVLGGMLLSKDAIADVVEVLKAHDFYRPNHSTVFDAILNLYGRGEPADPITVAAALADSGDLARLGGASYLHDLISTVPTAANAAYYAKIVSERAVLRRLVEAGTRIVQLGYGSAAGGGRDVDDVVDLAQQAIYDVTERRVSEDFAVLAEMLQPTLDEIEAVGSQGGMMTGVPTGFTDLDRLLNGLHAGQLIIVAGRPGLGKCLSSDAVITEAWTGERMTIAEFVRRGRAGERLGIHTLTDEWKLGVVTPSDFIHNGRRQVFRLTTRSGRTIRATANHPFRTLNEWRALEHLRPGDHIAVPRRLPPEWGYTRYPDPLVGLTAYLIGDGSLTGETPRLTAINPAIVADAGRCAARIGVRARPVAYRPCTTAECADPQRQIREGEYGHRHATALSLSTPAGQPNPLTDHLVAVGLMGLGSYDKHVPDEYLRMGRRQLRVFLSRLYATDGWACVSSPKGPRGKVSVQVGYASVSERLARDVAHLLLRLGLCADVVRKKVRYNGEVRWCWQVLLHRAEQVEWFCREIGIFGKDGQVAGVLAECERRDRHSNTDLLPVEVWDLVRAEKGDLLWAEVSERCGRPRNHNWHVGMQGIGRARLAELAKALDSDRLRDLAESDVLWDRIVSVEPDGDAEVFDLTIDGTHNFVANDIVVHNSTAAMDFARTASVRNNLASAIFSLEMSKVEIVMRLLSAEARVPLHVLRSGQLSDDDWTKLARRMGEISEAPLFVDDTPNMTLMEIRAKARRLKQRHDLKLIVVDYLQLMSSPKRVESRQQEVAELSRGLKLLAKEVECPVIAVSQLNRGPEQRTDKRPMLSDLRESGSIEQDADVVILLHRDDYYDKESPRAGEADFIVAKHRNGPTDTITVAAQLHFSRFVDMAVV